MTYVIPYEADFECPKGHKFTALVSDLNDGAEQVTCAQCYAEWIAANIPNGTQCTPARKVDQTMTFTCD